MRGTEHTYSSEVLALNEHIWVCLPQCMTMCSLNKDLTFTVFISSGCYDTVAQQKCIVSQFLEARRLRSRRQQGELLWGLLGRIYSVPLLASDLLAVFDLPWLADASPSPLPSSSHGVLPESACLFVQISHLYGHSHIRLGRTLMTMS